MQDTKIPKDVLDLMEKGICPVCLKPMKKANGKPTHSKTKALICEEILRERLKIPRTTFKINNKTYEVSASWQKKQDSQD